MNLYLAHLAEGLSAEGCEKNSTPEKVNINKADDPERENRTAD
jgi:hypothetical protein